MFTGIIETIGKIAGLHAAPGGHTAATRLEIEMAPLLDELQLGASVAVNGICLTLAERRATIGGFDVVPETWQQTTLRSLKTGDAVNLERALRIGGRLDGHFVQGHVDGMGTVERIERGSGQYKLWLTTDAALMPFIVRKGAIAIDGTSLTVVDVTAESFSVALVPTTLERTTLGQRRPGDGVNLETDILARLVVARLSALTDRGGSPAPGGLTFDQLRQAGYLE